LDRFGSLRGIVSTQNLSSFPSPQQFNSKDLQKGIESSQKGTPSVSKYKQKSFLGSFI